MTFQFDSKKDFEENLEDFLTHMDDQDAEMGAILRAHIDSLLVANDDAERRGARTLFNMGVKGALDEHLKKKLGEGDDQ
jgi:hypothetical protein